MEPKQGKIAIVVALIGLCGTLSAALLTNWDKIFGEPTAAPPTAAPPTQPAPLCSGLEYGGACWYWGGDSLSCTDTCAAHGGYDFATQTYAGSDGSAANCQALIQAYGIPMEEFFSTAQGGIGCFTIQLVSGKYGGFWDEQPTTASATSVTPGRQRLCACRQ